MIGIIGAMDEEVAILKESMEVQDTMERAGMTFVKGIMSGKEVVVVRSGIGKVNMGICAQILIDCFGVDTLINTGVGGSLDADMCAQILADVYHADHVINTGIAGSLKAEINIGDIVISTDAVQHDMDVSMLGDPVGQIPRMDTFSFPADEKLVKLAVEVNKEVNPDIQTFTGRVLSGDQFISGKEKKEYLVKTFDGKCAEMEGAAMAQTAYLNKVSYVIIRAISDKADNSATMDYPEFVKMAITHYVGLVKGLVERM